MRKSTNDYTRNSHHLRRFFDLELLEVNVPPSFVQLLNSAVAGAFSGARGGRFGLVVGSPSDVSVCCVERTLLRSGNCLSDIA